MRYLLFILILIGCGHHKSHNTKSPFEKIQENRDFIVSQIDDSVFKHRCDKLTFFSLYSAFGIRQDLSHFIYDDMIHRDTTRCYPEESRSEVSLDPILMMLHHIVSYGDTALLNEIIRIGSKRGWIMADGPEEYTNIFFLISTIYKLKSQYSLVDARSDISSVVDILSGYRGHIAAMYIYLQGRIYGELNEIEYQTMKQIFDSNPENPLYSAIYYRFTNGDQSYTINLLNKYFSYGIFPVGISETGWGSCPSSVLYITTVAIMEGR
jgi:hypothetical protein